MNQQKNLIENEDASKTRFASVAELYSENHIFNNVSCPHGIRLYLTKIQIRQFSDIFRYKNKH